LKTPGVDLLEDRRDLAVLWDLRILAYIKNYEPVQEALGGVLLYPVIDQDFDLKYEILGHPVRVVSVDLHDAWPRIHDRLLDVAGLPTLSQGL
jgi:5-methylcytosine-specific restriction enzyme subunit McrC